MTIKFLHTPIERIDQLCKEEEKVEVVINIYRTEHYNDGTPSQLVQKGGYGGTIKSSKDLIQFDDSDMKILSKGVKQKLR
jgi:hypothetical protein